MIDVTKIKAGDKVIVACGNTELTVERVTIWSDIREIIIEYQEGFVATYTIDDGRIVNESLYIKHPFKILEHIPQEPQFGWGEAKPGMCFLYLNRHKVWYVGQDPTNEDYVVGIRSAIEADRKDLDLYYRPSLRRHHEGDMKVNTVRGALKEGVESRETVTIDKNLEVKIHDEREGMTWDEAMHKFDNNPESEWRLPTLAEIRRMHRDSKVTGFSYGWYATSTKNSYGAVAAFNLYEKESMYGDQDEDYLIRLVRK